MATPKKKDKGHVFFGNNSLRCHNCGEELLFPESTKGGYSIDMISAMSKAYEKEHKSCKLTDAGKARFIYNTPEEWFKSWDVGTSSQTIYAVLSGRPVTPRSVDPPRDPSDFGRCYRLLKVCPPEWVASFGKVAERYPAWKPFIEAWPELVALWDEETTQRTDGMAPKLYERMKELQR